MVTEDARRQSVAPERSVQQRLEALERANRVRVARAEVKRRMKRFDALVTDLVSDPPPELESMKVFDLLIATPKIGRVKAKEILRREAISPSKTVGGLSERQRDALASVLTRYASPRS